jgi:hypothetical protein
VPAAAGAQSAQPADSPAPAAAPSPDATGATSGAADPNKDQTDFSKKVYKGVNDAGKAVHKGAKKVVEGTGEVVRDLTGTDKPKEK